MGYPMATNMRKKMDAAATLYIYDVDHERCLRFREDHEQHGLVVVADSPCGVAGDAAVVVTMLPSVEIIRRVYLDESSGILGAARSSSRLLLDCSTIDVQSTRNIGEAVAAAGAGRYIDAPVSVRKARPLVTSCSRESTE